jgi:thioredoxin reductase (NADPH)
MANREVDVAIVGAGPAALTAALYLARDGFSIVALEKAAVGGQVAITDQVDNYPGFPDGVSGLDLAETFRAQAEKFGVQIRMAEVTGIETHARGFRVATDDGEWQARAVLVATGSNPRLLDIPGEKTFFGRGVHTCATCDGAFYRDKKIAVIGGANTAIQETLYLSRIVEHIDLIVRNKLTASQILQDELQKLVQSGKVTLHGGTTPVEILGEKSVSGLKIRKKDAKMDEILAVDSIFVFIGRLPNTDFLQDIKFSDGGYIATDNGFMTSTKGTFAAGDVREGSTKQVATAVGEGAAVALHIRDYLFKN